MSRWSGGFVSRVRSLLSREKRESDSTLPWRAAIVDELRMGDFGEAKRIAHSAVQTGQADALVQLALHEATVGDTFVAERLAILAHQEGIADSVRAVAQRFKERGYGGAAALLLRQAAADGDREAVAELHDLFAEWRRPAQAEELVEDFIIDRASGELLKDRIKDILSQPVPGSPDRYAPRSDDDSDSVDSEPITPDEAAAIAPISGASLEHALATLFIRIGPPPEPNALNYAPASTGGGGVQQ